MRATICFGLLGVLVPLLGAVPNQPSEFSGADQKQIARDEQLLKTAKLATDGPALLAQLKTRTLDEADRDKVDLLIGQLAASSFKVREQAAQELIGRGPAVLEALRKALKHSPDLEIQRRSATCIQAINERHFPALTLAAVRMIGVRKPPGAVESLLAYLPFADSAEAKEEIMEVLVALAAPVGADHTPLAAALAEKKADIRAAAAEALIRAGANDKYKESIRPLLADESIAVRFGVASALAHAKERESIPVLIDLLPLCNQTQAWRIEDILLRLAEGKPAPGVRVGTDARTRVKCRDAWQTWWQANAANLNLGSLSAAKRLLGYTTMVLLDLGRVVEVDGDNQVRWQIDDLEFPLDIQVLDANRILIAEFHANRVTERNFAGKILWVHTFDEPQMAQRLPNGNTFMASKYRMLEVDPKGKQVFSHHVQAIDGVMKCMKLAAGDILCLFENSRVVRMNSKARELSGFRVKLKMRLSGGRIHALNDGRVLVPHNEENKVVEYDSTGRVLWQVAIDQPIAATRLANGNTLVTTMSQNRAVEFDIEGNEVWSYRQDTRVTRAIRR